MWGRRIVAGMALGLVLFIMNGCVRFEHTRSKQPSTIYSSSDATSLVYSHPLASAPVYDNPYRWLAFMVHPIGVMLDYMINRPFYRMAAASPATSGHTAEDAQLDLHRTGVTFEPQ
ncbi:MAG: hypothetical protein V3R16_00230 [Nitrospirales bacterium]